MNPKSTSLTPYYRTLTRNIVLLVMVISLAPMVIVTGIILNQFSASYHEKVFAHLEELVLKHKRNIDGFLVEKLENIRFLVEDVDFGKLQQEDMLAEHLSRLQSAYGTVFVDLGIVNEAGQQIAYAGPFKLGNARYADAEWFKQAIHNPYYTSDVFLGLRGSPHFIITVRKPWQGKNYILRATIDFVSFNRLVEQVRIGETGFAYILNREGQFQTKPIFDFTPTRDIYDRYFATLERMEKEVEIQERLDGTGVKCLYVSALLKNGDWLLVYKQVSNDAFSNLHNAQIIAIVFFILGGIVIVALAISMSAKMVRRIATSDTEKEIMNQQVIETGKLASVGELAAGIAHEINNPVAIMVEEAGWLQDLMADGAFESEEDIKEFERALNQIRVQGRRCKEITHKLLSFARKTDSRIEDFEVGPLLEELVSLSAQRAKYSNVELVTHLDEKLPAISASQSELQQVFLNLINNALDAMEKAGGVLEINAHQNDGKIVIEVADNGPGIPKANLARIFDPFFTTKPVGSGTGLGLSICYGIIHKMGGEIAVKSAVDVGTTFSIRLPIKTSESDDPETEETVSETENQ
ncbi:ATPase/histidine kinase/DNA gyrase B/HSP90 domain protein [Desulfosarcina cetonica]|uniref:sensor histidine kinase n=1 Tax=Desulfosarcina cetonica TaxID=90730 RepID=UPI0006D0AEE9|nr:PAS domain-containing sensor histidine kinase [Desulfosarcina cetonica]VTR64834.1 ATPase/histidine kinase/DNA gyrase B/HSP90 domain protein [Desulfosarcina cetonica]